MVEFIIGYIIGSNKDCSANMSLDTCGALNLEKIMLIGFVVFVISFCLKLLGFFGYQYYFLFLG